jgi:hypothetical protein
LHTHANLRSLNGFWASFFSGYFVICVTNSLRGRCYWKSIVTIFIQSFNENWHIFLPVPFKLSNISWNNEKFNKWRWKNLNQPNRGLKFFILLHLHVLIAFMRGTSVNFNLLCLILLRKEKKHTRNCLLLFFAHFICIFWSFF